ncbi:hypothetical protein ABPG74_004780 [Tetrahymena malaccensis]
MSYQHNSQPNQMNTLQYQGSYRQQGQQQKYPNLNKSYNNNQTNNLMVSQSQQQEEFKDMYPSIYQQHQSTVIYKSNNQLIKKNIDDQLNIKEQRSLFDQNTYKSQLMSSKVNKQNQENNHKLRQDGDEDNDSNIILTKEQKRQTQQQQEYTYSTKQIDELKVEQFKTEKSFFKRLASLRHLRPKHLADYGIGYSMYFLVLIDCLLILLLIFFISGLFSIYTNKQGDYCKNIEEIKKQVMRGKKSYEICIISTETEYSLANIVGQSSQIIQQDILVMITTIVLAIYMAYKHRRLKIINNKIDYQFISPSDFAIWIQYSDKTDIIEIQKNMKHCGVNEEYKGHKFLLFDDIVDIKNIEEQHYEDAIVVKAPEPDDIHWENLEISRIKQIFYKVVSFFLTVFFVGLCLTINAILIGFQKNFTESIQTYDNKGNLVIIQVNTKDAQYIAYIIFFFIFVSNGIFSTILSKLSSFESYYDKTREQCSFSIKLALIRFINIALIPFFVLVGFDALILPQRMQSDVYKTNGLIGNQYHNFIFTTVLYLIIMILDPGRNIKILIACLKKQIKNNEWQEPENNLSQMFSEMAKTMLFTAFYAPLIPMCLVISFIGLLLLYPIHLYKIIYHRRKTSKVSSLMPFTILQVIKYIVPIYAISNTMFQYILNPGFYHITIYAVISISVGICLILIPVGALEKCVNVEDKINQLDDELYSQNAKSKYKEAFSKYRHYYAEKYQIKNPLFKPNQHDIFYSEQKVKLYMEGRPYDGFACC